MELREQDKARVVRAIPGVVRAVMRAFGSRVVIGGGFVRDVIMGEEPTDVDLFLERSVDAGQVASFLMACEHRFREGAERFDTDNAITFRHWDARVLRYPVQIITRWRYETGVLATASPGGGVAAFFDFTMAQACVWVDSDRSSAASDKFGSFCSDDFYPDVAGRRLVYTSPQDDEAGGSLLRMRKFVARGWKITATDIAAIVGVLVGRVWPTIESGHATEEVLKTLRAVDPLPEDRDVRRGVDTPPVEFVPDDDDFPF